jgi:uncharacterized Zn-binding protein involved in type VI secretion
MPDFPAARVTDMHTCPMWTGLVPHVGGPILPPCSINVQTVGFNQARLSDMAFCAGGPDVIAMGATTVLVNGLPAARLTDMTVHGGVITAPGALTVMIGDPAFSLPPNFKIEGTPDFENKLIRDLYFLSTTATGKDLIARLAAAGKTITFVETNDANGYCSPNSVVKALLGLPTDSTISYNPNFSATVFDSGNNPIPEPPQVILDHEMNHALANSTGTHKFGTDPAPPVTEPKIPEEEAQAIGTGSHSAQNPSENTLRNELGLGRRDNHIGRTQNPGDPTSPNLRPGD